MGEGNRDKPCVSAPVCVCVCVLGEQSSDELPCHDRGL